LAEVEQQVMELERQWADATQRRDVRAQDRFLAKGYFLAIAVQGRPLELIARKAFLTHLKEYGTDSFPLDQSRVYVHGNTAAVFMLFSNEKSIPPGQFVIADIWNKEGKGWRVAERHWSRPAPPEEPAPK
jgi:hypothetical protein